MKYTINKNFKCREEKNGTYSFMNLNNMQIMFLNKTASIIYNNDKIKDIDSLVDYLCDKFDCPDKILVRDDCEKTIYYMECLGILDIKKDHGKSVELISIAGEKDFKEIANFINDSASDPNMFVVLGSNNIMDNSAYAIRSRQFGDIEYNFIHRNNFGKIDALLTFSYNKGSSILNLSNIIVQKNQEVLLQNMLEYVFETTLHLTKIRFMLEDNEKLSHVHNLIKSLKFTTEARLEKEFENMDLLIYSIIQKVS